MIKRRAKKIVDSGALSQNSIPLAHLTETIIVNDNLEALTEAIKSIPSVVIPESVEISNLPEYPSEMAISNLPEIQRVEIVNHQEKDDKETQKLLKELVAEVKKKEQYDYNIEIDSTLKEQLKGEKGEDGKDGVEITPEEVVSKLESLEEEARLDVSAIKGVDEFVQSKVEGIKTSRGGLSRATADTLYTPIGVAIESSFETVSSNLSNYDNTLNYNGSGDITDIVYSNGVTKTFNYTGADITSIVLSGSTPNGIELIKTLTYTNGDVTGITYT